MAESPESKSDNSWEEHSIDEDIMHPSDSGSGSSGDDSSPEEEPNEDDRDQEAVEIRGAQPYRFEPLVPPDQRRDRPDDDAGERGEGDQDRLHNTDWLSSEWRTRINVILFWKHVSG